MTDPEYITEDFPSSFTELEVSLGSDQAMITYLDGETEEDDGTPDDDILTSFNTNELFPPSGSTKLKSMKIRGTFDTGTVESTGDLKVKTDQKVVLSTDGNTYLKFDGSDILIYKDGVNTGAL